MRAARLTQLLQSMLSRKLLLWALVAAFFLTLQTSAVLGQNAPLRGNAAPVDQLMQEGQLRTPPLIAQLVTLVGLSLLPYFVMLLTSFLKMVVVLALLRNALGVQQAPPNQVINGLALILAIYVMYPTGYAMYERARPLFESNLPTALFSRESASFAIAVADQAKEPLRDFLLHNTRDKHEQGFLRLAKRYFPPELRSELKASDFIILVPAYVTSQVEDAFQIGVLIYLPFFVIDLVTSNILLAMGMMMLSPMTIATPIKLLLLVVLDGWTLLVQGLVNTFHP
jgi:type III secretion protein R